MTTTFFSRTCLAALLATAASMAQAVDWRPDAVSLQAGVGKDDSAVAGLGLAWDWDFERLRRHAALTAHTELIVHHWRMDALAGGEQSITQLVLLPSLRMHLSQGRSPWFLELGVGASYMDRKLVTPQRTFSTQWNFYDMLGAGYKFGDRGRHELGLRYVHVSNAGIRRPNPGQDMLQLRYALRF
jgi:lipid A 3-O-deacylase